MKKIFVIILLQSILVSSCYVDRILGIKPKGFTYKYDGINTKLDQLIEMDGYYLAIREKNSRIDSSRIVFYKDGLICYPDGVPDKDTYDQGIAERYTWGRYILVKDTIKAQIVRDFGYITELDAVEHIFLIKSKNEIVKVGEINPNSKKYSKGNIPYTFQLLENRIDSTNWLLKKGWFHK